METLTMPRLTLTALVILLASCGGGGGYGGFSNPTSMNALPGGIWRGTESVSGLQVVGLVDEAGDFHFVRSDNVQYVGTASVSINSVTANFDGYTQAGTTFPDGSTRGTGSVSGTIQARTTLTLMYQFRTLAGTVSNGTLNLTFDVLYNRVSSLTTISGNFTNPQNGVVVTVSSNGSVFSQDPTSGCVLNGTVTIINAAYNAYRVDFSYASCTGQTAFLNGLQFSGLGTLDNTVTPERAIIGVTAQSGGSKYSLVYSLNRS
jgi:hypothetical protein